jgi:hypothetical protein
MKMAGIVHPEDQLVILSRSSSYGYRTMFMAKKTPFTREELVMIREIAASRSEDRVLYPDMEKVARSEPIRLPGERFFRIRYYLRGDGLLQEHETHTRPDRNPGDPERAKHSG